MSPDIENDDTSAGERRAGLERVVREYRATRKRKLLELARKLRLRFEGRRRPVERDGGQRKIH